MLLSSFPCALCWRDFQTGKRNSFLQGVGSILSLTWGWNVSIACITGEYFPDAVDHFFSPFSPSQVSLCLERIPVARKGEGRLRRKENPRPKKLGEWAWQEGGGETGRGIYGKSRTQSRHLRLKIKSLASPSRACVYMHVGVFKVP